tara:strand:+ start:1144 stop:1515 length:372 start_codon:yes stop_codon:yes gene_type:complete
MNINKIFVRSFLILGVTMFCVSCATQTKISTSIDEQSGIIFEGNLIGTSIEVGSLIFQNIQTSDLTIDKTRTREGSTLIVSKKRILKINIDPGTTNIKVKKNGMILIDKDVYLSSGQFRRIKI